MPLDRVHSYSASYGLDSVGIVMSYGWTAGIRFSVEADISLLHNVQTGSGAQSAPYSVNTGGLFPWGKAAGG
jgi:hypothetical protein